MVIVMMGVSGSGKTTVGSCLAQQLGWEFADADDYHPAVNVEKMRQGVPLTDADRLPWLKSLRSLIAGWLATERNGVLACSALKRTYREKLRVDQRVHFVYLKADHDLLSQRLRARRDHYMKEQMLASQLATLEEPKHAIAVNAGDTPQQIAQEIRQLLKLA